ncbi:SDR family NAD(P)-dependent oxidoreductase [Salinisphaera orenii]|uniref:Dehydrogenase n=1 Tax=Salinisphaera orenii YIM 95161 TaxID=1051139 RepID=A0A423PW41_9GAMM|nr:glucose 1-dehydrogenase [Salinisphaera halophila]ROO29827.1 dehydrogenase [Salinisphaera halophila YIM 95161]
MNRLEGNVAIVTGGAQGIGAAYAHALAAEGARIVIADVLDGTAVAQAIEAEGGQAISVWTDVSDEASTQAMVDAAVERFGRVDILVNNAAIYASLSLKSFEKIDIAEWDKVMAVNVRGPFICARAVVPVMRENGYGRIVNISSGTPFKGTPNLMHYVTSKGAILALTRALAREVGGDGICVNTLAPGLVLSEGVIENADMRDALTAPVLASRAIKRDQMPEDLIAPLIFLSSTDCAFMTGETVVVDGGSVMH